MPPLYWPVFWPVGNNTNKEANRADWDNWVEVDMNTDFQRKRVLVVDDEPQVREAIATIMEFFGMEVTEAADGVDALERFREAEFDYVLTDHKMPRMCGDELANQIKSIRPTQRVVMVSGYAGAVLRDGQIPSTIDALVEKPCGVNELARALRGGLRGKLVCRS